ncbi:uncharacterized protein LOC128887729 [Hylaeus anthracinus]|uniref:uncharacterized protein LOC128887729 n=1 Tax=Hylaeus anthracinus TaxID=313031 RepID=UPI0023B8D361|nr:uncharacterized protein LOC128887729 [Hylaeus anthracinus]
MRPFDRDIGILKNSYYEHDINYALAVCRWVLRPIGMWSVIYRHTNKLEKLVSFGSLITCFSCLLFFIVPCGHYMLFEENGKVKERLIAPIIFCLASTIKYCYLVLRGTVLGRCIVHIETDWKRVKNSSHRDIMLQEVSISRNLCTLCAAFLYTAGLSYHTIMPLLSKGKAKGNGTKKSLAYPVYDAFVDTQSSPTYEIIFSIQFFTSLIRYSITLGVFSLLVLCVTHICGQIQIQISRLELLIEDMHKRKSKRNSLAIIVQNHAEILRFSKNIEVTLDEICLTQITESTLLISLLSYYCLKSTARIEVANMRDRSRNEDVKLVKNPNYEKDINYTLQKCRWILKLTGIWPLVYSRTSKLEKVVSTVLLVTWLSYLVFSLIPPGRYMIYEEKSLYKRLKLMGPFTFTISSTIKYCYLILKRTIFGRCIVQIEKNWKMVQNPIHRAIMLRNASTSRNLSMLCAMFLYAAGLTFHTIVPVFSKKPLKRNHTVRPLIMPGYDAFFDTQSSPNYEIIYGIQCIAGFLRYSITIAAFSLAVIFVTHICGQIQIQIARLEDFAHRKGNCYKQLDIVIRDHADTLKFSKNVEDTLCEICLTQIVESTLHICLLEYYLLKEWENSDAVAISTYSIYLVSFTFNTYIFCYIGEILSDQCSQIGPASYNIDWYNLPPKKACDLILMNAISLYPPKLSGGKIAVLCLNTFGAVSTIVRSNLTRLGNDD